MELCIQVAALSIELRIQVAALKMELCIQVAALSIELRIKVAALTMDLDLGIISESEKRLKKKLILDYIYANLKHHNFWAFRYFFCELLALINVIGTFTEARNLYITKCKDAFTIILQIVHL